MQGKPLYIKTLSKATCIAHNFTALQLAKSLSVDSFSLLSFNEWNHEFFEHLIQMHNSIIQ